MRHFVLCLCLSFSVATQATQAAEKPTEGQQQLKKDIQNIFQGGKFNIHRLIETVNVASQKLILKKILKVNSQERFDLSGLLVITPELKKVYGLKGNFLLIHDKSPWIYEAKLEGDTLIPSPWLNLSLIDPKADFDLEDIAASSKQHLFVINENKGQIYEISPSSPPQLNRHSPTYPVKEFHIKPTSGFEAIEVVKDALYIANEKKPLALFQLSNQFVVSSITQRNQLGSQTSLRYRNNKWYILDRERWCLWESSLLNQNETCISFSEALDHPEIKYVQDKSKKLIGLPAGLAEALDIHEKQFFIGLDNQGQALKKNRQDKRPSVLILELEK